MGSIPLKSNPGRTIAKSIGAAIVDIIFGPSSQQVALAHPAKPSADIGSLPPSHTEGDVTYVSGGMNYAESLAFCNAEHLWPLTLEFLMSEPASGAHYDEVHVQIFDEHDLTKLNTTVNGPFMLIKLPLGRYHVKAKLEGQTIERVVLVQPGHPVKQAFIF